MPPYAGGSPPPGAAVLRPRPGENGPCCYLHFTIERIPGAGGAQAPGQRTRLGGRLGTLDRRPDRSYGVYAHHLRFVFSSGGSTYLATLHAYAREQETIAILSQIVQGLRPAATIPLRPPGAIAGRRAYSGGVGTWSIAPQGRVIWVARVGIEQSVDPTPFGAPAVVSVDTGTGHASERFRVGSRTWAVAASSRAIWAASVGGSRAGGVVARLDPRSGRVVRTAQVGERLGALAVVGKELWAADAGRTRLVSLDPTTLRPTGRALEVGSVPARLATGDARTLWVTEPLRNQVVRVDTHTRRITARISVGDRPFGVAATARDVWVANVLDGTVSHIDSRSGRVVATVRVDRNPYAVAVAKGTVWVANEGDGTVTRLDPKGKGEKRVRVGGEPVDICVAAGGVWTTDEASGTIVRVASVPTH